MKRKILVFGVTGEIGGRIAILARDAGHDVTGVSRGLRKTAYDLDGINLISGDKFNEEFIANLASAENYDAIIDSVPMANAMRLYKKYFTNVSNIMVCSSTGVYVPLTYLPADEKHPWRVDTSVNFHHRSLEDAELISWYKNENFPITIFRPTNIIGEGPAPLELWGGRNIEFYRTLKGNRKLYIPDCEDILVQSGYNWDLASAFVLALDKTDEIRGEIFNISSTKAVPLGEFLWKAKKVLASTSETVIVSTDELLAMKELNVHWRFGLEFLMLHMCFDISKARDVLGYNPKVSTLDGLEAALRYQMSIGEL